MLSANFLLQSIGTMGNSLKGFSCGWHQIVFPMLIRQSQKGIMTFANSSPLDL